MKSRFSLVRGTACAASPAGTAIAAAPGVASAATVTKCGDKNLELGPEAGGTLHLQVQAISVEGGATCVEAVKVITGVLEGRTPSGWKSVSAKFEPPVGLVAQEVTKGSMKVKYAIHPG